MARTPPRTRSRTAAARARKTAKPPRDVAQEITDQIIALIEAGDPLPWRKPWRTKAGGGLPLRFNGVAYRGVNVIMLGLKAMTAGYASPYWMTFRQALELGAAVRKGERGATVVYYGVAGRRDAESGADNGAGDGGADTGGGSDADAAARGDTRRFLKWYAAFNAHQIDGLRARYHPEPGTDLDGGARLGAPLAQMADAMIAGLGVSYAEGGERACYIRSLDRIEMPEVSRFECGERYLATRYHECAHAVEHPKRLDINYGAKVFGNEAYSRCEIMALSRQSAPLSRTSFLTGRRLSTGRPQRSHKADGGRPVGRRRAGRRRESHAPPPFLIGRVHGHADLHVEDHRAGASDGQRPRCRRARHPV